jgi:hypothetical protein
VQRDRRLHDVLLGRLVAQRDEGRESAECAARRGDEHARYARVSCGSNVGGARSKLVGDDATRLEADVSDGRTARWRRGAALASRPACGGRSARESQRRGEIDDSRVHAFSGEIDDAGIGGRTHIGANRLDETIANDDGATLDDAARNGLDARIGECPGRVLGSSNGGKSEADK